MEPLHYLIAKTLASKNFSFILTKLLGFKKESEIESNIRRGFSRLILLLTALIIAQALFQPVFFENNDIIYRIYAYYFFVLSFVFFCSNIVVVIFKNDSDFNVNTTRLFSDIVISAIFHIVSFSFLYRKWGILDPSVRTVSSINFWDHLYFSSVTFSTLGYGDFRPSGNSRLIAAYEALIGNMHIGFLVGAAFLAASSNNKKASK